MVARKQSSIERPSRARKRTKTAHADVKTEQRNEVDTQPQSQKKQLGEENFAGSLEKEENASATESVLKPTKRKRKVQVAAAKEERTEIEEDKVELILRAKKKTKKESTENVDELDKDLKDSSKNPQRKRKTKEEKEAETMPLAPRSVDVRFFIGAHVSAAKGVHNAVTNCLNIGGNAFALFLKSQRKWTNPPLLDEHRVQFKNSCVEHKYDPISHVLPHGSYLVNLAQEDPTKAKQSYDAFLDDLKRCEALGIRFYNFHPGSTNSSERVSAIARIAAHLNASHAATSTVTPLLETMAGDGTKIGSSFEDLAEIIALVDDKSRIGVCLDTCHVFAAGYDLCSREAFQSTLAQFDSKIGRDYLKAVHLNDSKAPLGSRVDRHANLGTGFLGLGAFWNIMNEPRFEGLPMVLETPAEDKAGKEDLSIYAREIKLLESLVGMDRDGEEFHALEAELARKAETERKEATAKFEEKVTKAAKKREKKAWAEIESRSNGSDSQALASIKVKLRKYYTANGESRRSIDEKVAT